jgi:hypothetical protein
VQLGNAGEHLLTGQQTFVNEGSQPVFAYCWMSTTYSGTSELPYGPASDTTVPAGGYVTVPLNGSYASGATELYVVCRATNPSGTVLSTVGDITATLVP